MQYGLVFPSMNVHTVPVLAAEAEAAGWDGVFIPDCISIDPRFTDGVPMHTDDPFIVLAAVALRTERMRLGTMLSAPSRRRPWKLARELTTLDQLSNGRMVLPVGLGALDDQGFGAVGEPTDRKTRAELLDDALAILDGLWSGNPFSFTGKHYTIDNLTFAPTPVQRPRIPIWVVGLLGNARSLGRAAHWDGLLPNKRDAAGMAEITPDDIRETRTWLEAERARQGISGPYDIVMEGSTSPDDAAAARDVVGPLREAGATWWLESFWTNTGGDDAIRRRIAAGPPRVD
jgi:alkanesulfonate monooxygenase SsuD/methylene tetrahydromethanopterin reductase-like flavin-dependent oxidoreductase (luciferase family)